jgi:hypothetical protein
MRLSFRFNLRKNIFLKTHQLLKHNLLELLLFRSLLLLFMLSLTLLLLSEKEIKGFRPGALPAA